MSETPRTDQRAMNYSAAYISMRAQDVILADFARTLEREIAALRETLLKYEQDDVRYLKNITALKDENERLRGLLREALREWTYCTVKCDHSSCLTYKRICAALEVKP